MSNDKNTNEIVQIKEARIEDLEGLKNLNAKIFVDNPSFDEDLMVDFPFTTVGDKTFRDWIETRDGCCFIAWEDGEMVGYVNGAKLEFTYRKSKYFEIQNLGVIPEKRKSGLGRQLLEKVT